MPTARILPSLLVVLAALNIMASSPASAQTSDTVRRIRVAATGVDRATPDIARLSFTVRGEGKSADEATAAVAASMKAIETALDRAPEGRYVSTVGNLTMGQVRDRACDEGQSYPPKLRLSTGACAIVGYIADVRVTLRLSPATKAGTMAGVVARAGGLNAQIEAFELASPATARKRAMATALKQAQAEAQAIATASGLRLGPVLAINNDNDRGGDDIILTARRGSEAPPPPPPPPPPPAAVQIAMTPSPIFTNATITVFYGIAD